MHSDFGEAISAKIYEQLTSRSVGFLLGAGSSYLEGAGYPLASELWALIARDIPDNERSDIQAKLDDGASGLEEALDLLDTGNAEESPHRQSVVDAISRCFCKISPTLELHQRFVSLIKQRNEEAPIRIFTLNYDPLVELAAEKSHVRLFDGFYGQQNAFFDPGSFRHNLIIRSRSWRGRRSRGVPGSIRLIKLHGSLGWYQNSETAICRRSYTADIPECENRLMIPPQYRKARDTGRPPYSTLWSEYRGALFHGDDMLNRLITIGYGFTDEHVNTEIESALERHNFTLIVIAKSLQETIFNKWCRRKRVHIVTKLRCSMNGEIGPGDDRLCSFEGFIAGAEACKN